MAHPDGELATAAGAARAGALYVLSTRSTRRIEDVGAVVAAAGGTWWFQVYVMRDRELTAGLVRRAAMAGAAALVLTGDTPVVGHKRSEQPRRAISDEDFLVNLGPLADLGAAAQAADATFADIGWLTETGGGLPVIVKGVLRPDDALACAAHGAAGVIVSNHGGRQLDGATPTARALPAVVAAARAVTVPAGTVPAGTVPAGTARAGAEGFGVYVDGGIRTGQDVLTALALGAQAVFVGRPVLWALTCGGADGVRELLTGLTAELAHVMALAGAASVAEVPASASPAAGPPAAAAPPAAGHGHGPASEPR
jgi:4-hydroxymandelate oxidase